MPYYRIDFAVRRSLSLILVVLGACGGETVDGSKPLPPPRAANTAQFDEGLRAELLQRAARDQQMIMASARTMGDSAALAQVSEIFADNAQYMRNVLATKGWPGISLAGQDGSSAAWLIIQHSDSFPDLQDRALVELEKAALAGDASGSEYAMLADRVRKNRGQKQLFGSQVAYDKNGDPITPEVESPDSLDARRAKYNLQPMAEYLAQLKQINAKLRAMQDSVRAEKKK